MEVGAFKTSSRSYCKALFFLDHFCYWVFVAFFFFFFLDRAENHSLKCFYFETICFVLPLVLRRLKSTSTKRIS